MQNKSEKLKEKGRTYLKSIGDREGMGLFLCRQLIKVLAKINLTYIQHIVKEKEVFSFKFMMNYSSFVLMIWKKILLSASWQEAILKLSSGNTQYCVQMNFSSVEYLSVTVCF